jgi:hypothetical protein
MVIYRLYVCIVALLLLFNERHVHYYVLVHDSERLLSSQTDLLSPKGAGMMRIAACRERANSGYLQQPQVQTQFTYINALAVTVLPLFETADPKHWVNSIFCWGELFHRTLGRKNPSVRCYYSCISLMSVCLNIGHSFVSKI